MLVDVEFRTWAGKPTGRALTYSAPDTVQVGDVVALPPLPWQEAPIGHVIAVGVSYDGPTRSVARVLPEAEAAQFRRDQTVAPPDPATRFPTITINDAVTGKPRRVNFGEELARIALRTARRLEADEAGE